MKNKCAWIVSPLGVHPQTFCSKPTGYVMATDAETEQRVRVYHTYCPEHLVEAKKQDDAENED